ncbi:MAG: hypothetical protein ABIL44_05960 [candidate division WOR-3 bacterium]
MGAHVFIVNEETFPITQFRCVAAVVRDMGRRGKYVEKTRADILADLSCIRKGDRVFFYEIGVGFHGIYETVSLPFIDEDEIEGRDRKYLFGNENNSHFIRGSLILPNRVLIEPKKYLVKPVNEWRNASRSAFGRFTSAIDLRSPFYKKALGRGKSITHLFPEEEATLIELLMEVNNGQVKKLDYKPYKPRDPKPIKFDLTPTGNGEVKYEKILEGWIIQNLDNPSSKMDSFLGDLKEIECFANYVPVSIAGGNLDIVVFHRKNNKRYKITIIELKKGMVKQDDINQIKNYVKWAAENLTKIMIEKHRKIEIGLLSKMEMIQPIIIGKGIDHSALEGCKMYSLNSLRPILIQYDLEPKHYKINFSQIGY